MSDLYVVNQGSTGYIEVPLYDRNGAAAVPNSATYSIHDLETGTQIRAATALTPAATLNINLVPADNVLVNAASQFEVRRVTIVAVYGVSDQLVEQYDYIVERMTFLSV